MANAINNEKYSQEYLTTLAKTIIYYKMGEALYYLQLTKQEKHWDVFVKLFVNDLGRLSQGVGNRVKGTETNFFILYDNI